MTLTLENSLSAALRIARSAWNVTAEMSPYLLFGFLLAGVFSVALPAAWVARHLGRRSWTAPLKAALFGVPMPLCSCGVIPVTAHLRRSGAGPGATAAFLMSTPQTGVDSMLVTYGLLGPVFAWVRPLVALVSGAVCGWMVEAWGGRAPEPDPASDAPPPGGPAAAARPPAWRRALRHGFGVIPRDIYRALIVGLLIAGVFGALVPPDVLAGRLPPGLGGSLLAMVGMMLIGIPLYVCSTASVPIGVSLLLAGVPPGAVLVFLVTGPATNAATIATLVRLLGARSTVIYIAVLVVSVLLAGLALDAMMPELPARVAEICAHDAPVSPAKHLAGLILAGVLAAAAWNGRKKRAS